MAIASLLVSVLAVVVAVLTALRQVRAAQGSTHSGIALDVLRQYLDGDFSKSEKFVRSELPGGPAVALRELPAEAFEHAQRVATLYQTLGYLAAARIADPETVRYLFGVNAVRSWRSLHPYIEAQRLADPGGVGYRFFEDLAARCSAISAQTTVRRFKLRSFTAEPPA